MRILIGGICHESHSFSLMPTRLADFGITRGEALRESFADTSTEIGGFLEGITSHRWEAVPALYAMAWPAGPLTRDSFESLVSELVTTARSEHPLDGVLLALHGSMLAEHCDDCEGELLDRLRLAIGPDVPIAMTLDLHATVTEKMIQNANFLTSYRTTPHIDLRETGLRAVGGLRQLLAGESSVRYVRRRPMLTGMDLGRTIDPSGPMPALLEMARRLEITHPEVWDISICAGFPYADTYDAGPSVIVTAASGTDDALGGVDRILDTAWQRRRESTIEFSNMSDAVTEMHSRAIDPKANGPLIVADYSDGVAGGGYGDSVVLLEEIIRSKVPNAVYGMIFDPEVVDIAFSAGTGSDIEVFLGAKSDPRLGAPVQIRARVERLSDGLYIRKGPFMTNTKGDLGRSALITTDGVQVIVCSRRIQAEDREQFRIFGIDPEGVSVLACKGINHFRADFEPIASKIIFVDTGGLVTQDVTRFPFRRIRRPIWPLDPF